MSPKKSPSKRARRSPNYPSTGLPEAVSFLRKIYDKVGPERVAEDTLAQALGYTKDSSWLNLLLSSLLKYGLLDAMPGTAGRPRSYQITEAGVQMATVDADSPLRLLYLRKAALRPAIYQDLWERFGPQLPEIDDAMANYLVTEQKFTRDAAFKMLAHFRSTITISRLRSAGAEKPKIDATTLDAYSKVRVAASGDLQTVPAPGQTHYVLGQPFTGGPTVEEWRKALQQNSNERTTAMPLAEGETATITMPKKMSPQSWQMLIDTLELWKKQAGAAE
jgi:hypothetical protein